MYTSILKKTLILIHKEMEKFVMHIYYFQLPIIGDIDKIYDKYSIESFLQITRKLNPIV